jgi:hypothetical protein
MIRSRLVTGAQVRQLEAQYAYFKNGGDGRVLAPGVYRAELRWRGQPMPAPSTWFALVVDR